MRDQTPSMQLPQTECESKSLRKDANSKLECLLGGSPHEFEQDAQTSIASLAPLPLGCGDIPWICNSRLSDRLRKRLESQRWISDDYSDDHLRGSSSILPIRDWEAANLPGTVEKNWNTGSNQNRAGEGRYFAVPQPDSSERAIRPITSNVSRSSNGDVSFITDNNGVIRAKSPRF